MSTDINASSVLTGEIGTLQTPPPGVDLVNHPPHYMAHPSGIETIVITEHMNFCLGNAMKYIWRAGSKGSAITDLEKAVFYLNREIDRLKKNAQTSSNT